jgi:hypothetical protein
MITSVTCPGCRRPSTERAGTTLATATAGDASLAMVARSVTDSPRPRWWRVEGPRARTASRVSASAPPSAGTGFRTESTPAIAPWSWVIAPAGRLPMLPPPVW